MAKKNFKFNLNIPKSSKTKPKLKGFKVPLADLQKPIKKDK